jgi:hypothetical protein
MENKPNQIHSNKSLKKSSFPALALFLAFLPSVAFFAFITFIRNGSAPDPIKPALLTLAGLSLGCCIASSTMLFKRRTALAIGGGLLLLILNTFIVLFLGCTASISNLFE